jgi:hypothetical protein
VRKLADQFSLKVDGIDTAEAEIARIQETFDVAMTPKILDTVDEVRDSNMAVWLANRDFLSGLEFYATMQLRTPLRVLAHHGEIHSDLTKSPPKIERELWEGIWIPKTKTWRELGADIDEMPGSTQASDIGQIVDTEYLPFLIAIRQIVELNETIEHRVRKLREMLALCPWQDFLHRHGGTEVIVQYFFPRHITPMPSLPVNTWKELSRLGFDTPNGMAAASDKELLGIKGIGRVKLHEIRQHYADMAKDPDADRVENVTR